MKASLYMRGRVSAHNSIPVPKHTLSSPLLPAHPITQTSPLCTRDVVESTRRASCIVYAEQDGKGFQNKPAKPPAQNKGKKDSKTKRVVKPEVTLTVISGFNGSGKEELVSDLMKLHEAEPEKKRMRLSMVDELEEDDLVQTLWDQAESGNDRIIVQTSDIVDPEEFVTFLAENANGKSAPATLLIDSLVTCVDISTVLGLLSDPPQILSAYPELAEADPELEEEGLAPVDAAGINGSCALPIIKQIEYADILVISGFDKLSPETLEPALAVVRTLNPLATYVLRGPGFPPVKLREIVGKEFFDPEQTPQNSGWMQALATPHDDGLPAIHATSGFCTNHYISPTLTLTTAIYRSNRPFHPERLYSEVLLNLEQGKHWPGLLRTSGFFFTATRHDQMGLWHGSSRDFRHTVAFEMDGAVDGSDLEREEGIVKIHGTKFNSETLEPVRDGRWQSLVFIGLNLDYPKLKAALDRSLLTDKEVAMGPAGWEKLNDPMPEFYVENDDSEHDHEHEDEHEH